MFFHGYPVKHREVFGQGDWANGTRIGGGFGRVRRGGSLALEDLDEAEGDGEKGGC